MSRSNTQYEVIVIGGGHAGTEAALAAARAGARTLLLTHKLDTVGQMSCNPAIGGIGKGHLTREIDALGGAMAGAIDRAGIQFRTLNARKGPAVRATRAQADRVLYRREIRRILHEQPGLTLLEGTVVDLSVRNDRIAGVVTGSSEHFSSPSVVLTVGTFLAGRMHVGEDRSEGGRVGDPPANRLAQRLRTLDLRVGRLKTGTPPRLDGRRIDYRRLIEQPGDQPAPVFSFIGSRAEHPRQISCHLTATNEATHDIIRAAFDRSPMFSGAIEGVGPRYCPSVEDKVARFADRPSHQIFLEPEGLDTPVVYPNGISTSLPQDVQEAFVRSIAGLEAARITQPGYAIEYDYFDPRDLEPTLQTRAIRGLYFAGQINGTTGYEEAAAQGLLAGLNAARGALGSEPWYPQRNEAYLGVLIDDLVTRGTSEPYRMFTSRAEYRLLLREDNADLRLTPTGRKLGLVDDHRWRLFDAKREAIDTAQQRLANTRVRPRDIVDSAMVGGALSEDVKAGDLLQRPGVQYEDLLAALAFEDPLSTIDLPAEQLDQARRQVEIQARYAGYIERQSHEIERQRRHEQTPLPRDFDYDHVSGLSNEVRQKLSGSLPVSIGQAARIAGVTPAAISLLLVHLKKTARKSA